MKIAYIVEPRRVIGGGVRAAINLSKAMTSYFGEEAKIFGVYSDSVKDSVVNFEEVKTLNPISFSYLSALYRFLKSYNPDIVHGSGLDTILVLVFYRMAFNFNYKVVCTVHRVTQNMRFSAIMKLVIPFVTRRIDYTTFLTNYQRIHYFDYVKFRPEKNIIIPNVIYVEQNSEESIAAKREELLSKVDANDLTCYVGRIVPSKNIEDTIRLVGILNRRGLKLGVILVGGYENDYFTKLQQLIKSEGIQDKVYFEGYVNNPTLYIGACTTTTTTTYSEALPNLMVETFALGKVIFSSDIPQMVDLISNGKNGFTHSLKDLEGMADDMQRVYADITFRQEIEKNAFETYKKYYDPYIVSTKYHDVYARI